MCWLVVRKRSNAKLRAYKAGDIVGVFPDDWQWGTLERGPGWACVKIQIVGVPADRVKARLEEVEQHGELQDDGRVQQVMDRVRRWRVLLANLPASAKTALVQTGELSVTKTQALAYIRNTLNEAPELD